MTAIMEKVNSIGSEGAWDANAVPMVSVCCLAYNHEKYLRQALDGFLGQKTSFPVEIVIHEDCSTDGTAAIIREYEEKYPGILRPLYQKENQYSKGIHNISGVFNFPRARGKYIAMCEGDDFWCDMDKLQKQVSYMEAHPECSMCCHAAGIAAEDGAFRSERELRPFAGTRVLAPAEVISKKINIPMASLLFRTEYAKALPQYYYDCPVGDIPLHLHMLTKGNVYYFDEVMSVYRMGREGSWGRSMDSGAEAARKWERHYEDMKALFEAFLRETGGDGPGRDPEREYAAACAQALSRTRFLIDLKEDKPEAVLDPANAAFLGELPASEQRLLRLKAKHRGVYELLRRGYGFFRAR